MPNVPYISSSDHESTLLISESFSATLETSLFLFQIKKKQSFRFKRRNKTKTQTKVLKNSRNIKKIAAAVAPGQTEEFIDDVLTENTNKDEFSVPGDI